MRLISEHFEDKTELEEFVLGHSENVLDQKRF